MTHGHIRPLPPASRGGLDQALAAARPGGVPPSGVADSLTGMARHGRTGKVALDPETARVTLDGEPVAARRLDRVTLSRLYFM
jgi:hypothetical protein